METHVDVLYGGGEPLCDGSSCELLINMEADCLLAVVWQQESSANRLRFPPHNTQEPPAAEENGEELYEEAEVEVEVEKQSTPQEEPDLYQTPEETAAGGATLLHSSPICHTLFVFVVCAPVWSTNLRPNNKLP